MLQFSQPSQVIALWRVTVGDTSELWALIVPEGEEQGPRVWVVTHKNIHSGWSNAFFLSLSEARCYISTGPTLSTSTSFVQSHENSPENLRRYRASTDLVHGISTLRHVLVRCLSRGCSPVRRDAFVRFSRPEVPVPKRIPKRRDFGTFDGTCAPEVLAFLYRNSLKMRKREKVNDFDSSSNRSGSRHTCHCCRGHNVWLRRWRGRC